MTKDKKIIQWIGLVAFTFILAISCENDNLEAGYDILGNPMTGNKEWVDLVAYNIFNEKDSIRSDESVLTNAVLGVYNDNVFGTSRADYVTQLRLSSNNFTFTDSINSSNMPEATVDSAICILVPNYAPSDTVSTKKIYTHLGSTTKYDNNTTDNVDTFRIVTKYKLNGIYPLSPTSTSFPISINTVTNFLFSTADDFTYAPLLSKSNVSIGQQLSLNSSGNVGNYTVTPYIYTTKYADTKGNTVSQIYTYSGSVRSTKNVAQTNAESVAGYRIPLDKSFFQTNIINKQGSNDLIDDARFIRFINGIKITVDPSTTQGFLINFNPSLSNQVIRLYYSYTKKKSSGTITTGNTYFDLSLNSANNVKMGLYAHTRNGIYQSGTSTNAILGNNRLYLQGMGGPKIAIKLDDAKLAEIRNNVSTKGWSIIDAKLRFNEVTADGYNLDNPRAIHGYLYDDTAIPVAQDYKKYTIFQDFFDFRNKPAFYSNEYLNNTSSTSLFTNNSYYDRTIDPKYYEISLTSTLKDIVEKNGTNNPIIVEMGNYEYVPLTSQTYGGLPYVYNYGTFNSGSKLVTKSENFYSPFRMVFYGNTETDITKKLRLEITYSK